jgi:hypothetical protein
MAKKEYKKERAFKWFEALRSLTRHNRIFVWDRAELMWIGKDRNYWKELGYESYNQFINDPELLI